MPGHTIASTNGGVTLKPVAYYDPVTVTAGSYVSGPQAGIYASNSWIIANQGAVVGTSSSGVLLEQGGSVINGLSGATVGAASISGAEGVYMRGAAGSVINYGTIGGNFDGILLDEGGTVTNGASGAIGARIIGGIGVFVTDTASTVGAVINDGTIIGTAQDGVLLGTGGSVLNGAADPTGSTALIAGNSYGVYVKGGAGTVTNYGTLQGGYAYGARLDGGGTLVNGLSVRPGTLRVI